jgi:hypothetical protein
MKKFFVMILACAFAFQGFGCTGLIVKKAEKPESVVESPPVVTKADKPYEVKQEVLPERMELVSEFPPGIYKKLKLGGRPVSPVDKNSVKKLEDEARKTGKTIFVSQVPIVLETMGGNKKWYRGIVEPGHVFLTEMTFDPKTGIKEYQLTKLGICNNPVRGAKVRVMPTTQKIVERYRDTITTKVVERYRDVDYTPAIWTGLAGILLGYFIHPAAGTRTLVSGGPCVGGACAPGVPLPRPGP